MNTVYLAGPIAGLSYAGATDWRDYAISELADAGIKGLSPMRGKDHLKHIGTEMKHPYPVGASVQIAGCGSKVFTVIEVNSTLSPLYHLQRSDDGFWVGGSSVFPLAQDVGISATCEEYGELSPLSGPRGIMTRDRFDATRCDVLLVNLLGAEKVSIGTVMEMAWADLKRTPIVVAIEPSGNPHEHAMISQAIGFRCSTLDEALQVTKAVLS